MRGRRQQAQRRFGCEFIRLKFQLTSSFPGGWDLSTQTWAGQTYFGRSMGRLPTATATGCIFLVDPAEVSRLHFLRYNSGIYYFSSCNNNTCTSPVCNKANALASTTSPAATTTPVHHQSATRMATLASTTSPAATTTPVHHQSATRMAPMASTTPAATTTPVHHQSATRMATMASTTTPAATTTPVTEHSQQPGTHPAPFIITPV